MTAVITNLDPAVEAMARIELHPEQHHQAVWAIRQSCGTAYCLAGMICVVSGLELEWYTLGGAEFQLANNVVSSAPDHALRSIPLAALDLLGVDPAPSLDVDGDMAALFASGNTKGDLYRQLAGMAGVLEEDLREDVAARVAELAAAASVPT